MTRSTAPTLQDLAKHLGVHKSTVSRAIDPARRHLVAPDLLQRIEAAARELGYRPNHAAAALSRGRSKTIGVLLPDITNPVFPPILRGIEDALDEAGYFALLANTSRPENSSHTAQVAVERMQAQRVEGFLVATATRDDAWLESLRQSGAQIVLINRTDGRGHLPAVISDDMLGMRLAVDHVVGLGHRQIAHLGGPESLSTGLARRMGFEQAMREHKLKPTHIVSAESYAIDSGDMAMQQLLALRQKKPFTAVVTANDLIALGALQALQRAGIRVPQEVSIVGHNDMPLLDQVNPPLTSVRIQHYEMGFRAARLLLDALRQRPGSQDATVVLRPQLVVRASTSGPPHAGPA
ncbi:LacI family DNA-binding transcriptional regulator [Limnohabitans sp. JirII-31]|uniref:LacI family DNA-binding transcriptional regulator n=1 Tax=Limnohabitans sp. JirII-31 TaxID=1977908 RepID=UPI000C1ECEEF|nr:LacI family DNA-binding transcriptional regulator [Limnohabitans sp. JirII-31]PIT74319.1 LacI family transcriptional regulator [Limnohabitans sp. JirII-31]